MIVPVGKGKWQLLTQDVKRVISKPTTYEKALAQERAINISKARKAGHRIPYPKR